MQRAFSDYVQRGFVAKPRVPCDTCDYHKFDHVGTRHHNVGTGIVRLYVLLFKLTGPYVRNSEFRDFTNVSCMKHTRSELAAT